MHGYSARPEREIDESRPGGLLRGSPGREVADRHEAHEEVQGTALARISRRPGSHCHGFCPFVAAKASMTSANFISTR